jgi:hypothetical protein
MASSFLRWSPNAQPFYVTRGSRVFSTHPQWPSEGKVAGRGQHVYAVKDPDGRHTWPGSGGYWKWVYPESSSSPREQLDGEVAQ